MLKEKTIELKKIVLSQANLVENMIDKAIKGLINYEESILREVIEFDENTVNNNELLIDEKCVGILALYHPEAKDLRTIMMISKMNTDLERMGDSAVNIAESALYLVSKPQVKPYIDLPKMSKEVMKMVNDSINSFVNENEIIALDVCQRDSIVDNYRDQILRELITYMFSDPSTIERSLHLIRISNNLERIADLATNISEETIYIIKGKTIKHHKFEEI